MLNFIDDYKYQEKYEKCPTNGYDFNHNRSPSPLVYNKPIFMFSSMISQKNGETMEEIDKQPGLYQG
ncbi:MAG: hypothetical protein WEB89_12285 [Balneolales bacterium]